VSDLHDLIRACKAEPDDDAPRLILADWLDEHGEAERAAFIRAQIARPDDASIGPNLEWAGEWKRWADHWHAKGRLDADYWQTTQPDYPLRFRRGFLRVGDYYRELYDRLPQLLQPPFDWTWLDEIQFGSGHDGDWTPLFRSERLLELNHLVFTDDRYKSVLVEPLTESPFIKNLVRLYLGCVLVHDSGAARLSQVRALAGLRSLDLMSTQIGPAGAHAMANSEVWDNLRSCSLRGNDLGDQGLSELATGRRHPLLEALDVAHCKNSDDGLAELAKSDRFPRLRALEVGYHEGYPERPVFGRRGLESILRSEHFRDVRLSPIQQA